MTRSKMLLQSEEKQKTRYLRISLNGTRNIKSKKLKKTKRQPSDDPAVFYLRSNGAEIPNRPLTKKTTMLPSKFKIGLSFFVFALSVNGGDEENRTPVRNTSTSQGIIAIAGECRQHRSVNSGIQSSPPPGFSKTGKTAVLI